MDGLRGGLNDMVIGGLIPPCRIYWEDFLPQVFHELGGSQQGTRCLGLPDLLVIYWNHENISALYLLCFY